MVPPKNPSGTRMSTQPHSGDDPDRTDELPLIIQAYASEAHRAFLLPQVSYPEDLAWVLEHASSSITDIAQATRRLAALRRNASLFDAAQGSGDEPRGVARVDRCTPDPVWSCGNPA